MPKVTVTATRLVEQTLTVDINVGINEVKRYIREYYDSDYEWNDTDILTSYLEDHEEILDKALGSKKALIEHDNTLNEPWVVQYVEEV